MSGRNITRTSDEFVVTKTLAAVEIGPDDSADGPGTFSLILSTDAVDRDGEVVESGAFNPLPDHISMDVDHGMSVATTVGSGRPWYNAAGQLQVDGTFASTDLGQQVRTLVREGHVRTASVAMIPTRKTKSESGATRIVKADLLNGAFTPVPSNTTATVLSAKSVADLAELAEVKAGARHSAADMRTVQAIHDLTAGLGAVCGDGSSEGKHVHEATHKNTDEVDTKTVEAPVSAADSAVDAAAVKAAADSAVDAADNAAHDAVVAELAATAIKAAIQ